MSKAKHVMAVAGSLLLTVIPLSAASSTANKTSKDTAKMETISGKIAMVVPDKKLVVVKTSDGVTYDMDIDPGTKIESGGQTLALKDLTQDMNENVSVKFTAEHRGDIARTIEING
jgi:hypothetical protein